MMFKIKSFMVPQVKLNYPSDPQYTKDRWTCYDCADEKVGPTMICSQPHVLVCEGHADLRVGVDLQEDRNLVQYYREVISRRYKRAELQEGRKTYI